MPHVIEGQLSAKDLNLAVIVSRFNSMISDKLLSGCIDVITRSGGDSDKVTIVKVPGAFEIPLTAKKLAETKKYDAVICLGAVIRGGTPHFDYVASEMSKGIANVMLSSGIPISFGVVTTDNLEQAIERSGTKMGNKGEDATLAAIEMVHVLRRICDL